jgi:hypothetical protein
MPPRPEKKKNPGSSSSSRRASSHQSIHNEQAHPQLPASTGEPTPDPAFTDYPQRAAPVTWLHAAPQSPADQPGSSQSMEVGLRDLGFLIQPVRPPVVLRRHPKPSQQETRADLAGFEVVGAVAAWSRSRSRPALDQEWAHAQHPDGGAPT